MERVDDDLIQGNDDGQLKQHRETAAEGRILLLLIHGLYLFGHLLLRRLVGAPLVFVPDRHFFRPQRSLLDLVLLLFDAERYHEQFYYERKYEERQHIVAGEFIQPAEELSYPA